MKRSLCARTASGLLLLAVAGVAQTPPPADPPPPPAAWSIGGVSVSGYVDTYIIKNFNNPASGVTGAQNFTVTSNRMSLNNATITLSRDPGPVGFRIDAGLGRTYDVFHLTEPSRNEWSRQILNAYVAFKPAAWKGLQVDFGKFVTSAGAEVTESHLNWNYSRSLLFTNGPFYHVGLRTTMPVTKSFTAGVQLVNGWNNLRDQNDGKTLGLTGAYTKGKVSWFNVYYVGQENFQSGGVRNFYDTTLLVTPNSRTAMYLNFDFGNNKNIDGTSSQFLGVAGSARFALTNRFAVSPRLEWYNDADGFITGRAQQLKEFTLTGEWKILQDNIISRVEYRHDRSNQRFFERGPVPGASRHQNTLLVAFMFVAKPWR